MLCPTCSKEIVEDSKFCVFCGNPVFPKQKETTRTSPFKEGVSSAWYLLPIFLGLIGGIIAWAVIRDRDSKKARKMLIVAVILTVMPLIIGLVFWGSMMSDGSYNYNHYSY